MYCPTACTGFDLIPLPTAGCTLSAFRKNTIARLAFMKCDIVLPPTFDQTTTPPLFTGPNPDIVMSSPLRNVVVNDPETEDIIVHDCAPPQKFVNRRTLSFEDAIKIEVPESPGPPIVPANPFFDYDWWKDKKEHRLLLRYGWANCAGDFFFARDENGNLMEAWFDVFLSYQKLGNNGGTLEFKKGTLEFSGDFMDFNKPDFNLVTFGINV